MPRRLSGRIGSATVQPRRSSHRAQLYAYLVVQPLDPAVVVRVYVGAVVVQLFAVLVRDAVRLGVVLDVDNGPVLPVHQCSLDGSGPLLDHLPAIARTRPYDRFPDLVGGHYP